MEAVVAAAAGCTVSEYESTYVLLPLLFVLSSLFWLLKHITTVVVYMPILLACGTVTTLQELRVSSYPMKSSLTQDVRKSVIAKWISSHPLILDSAIHMEIYCRHEHTQVRGNWYMRKLWWRTVAKREEERKTFAIVFYCSLLSRDVGKRRGRGMCVCVRWYKSLCCHNFSFQLFHMQKFITFRLPYCSLTVLHCFSLLFRSRDYPPPLPPPPPPPIYCSLALLQHFLCDLIFQSPTTGPW